MVFLHVASLVRQIAKINWQFPITKVSLSRNIFYLSPKNYLSFDLKWIETGARRGIRKWQIYLGISLSELLLPSHRMLAVPQSMRVGFLILYLLSSDPNLHSCCSATVLSCHRQIPDCTFPPVVQVHQISVCSSRVLSGRASIIVIINKLCTSKGRQKELSLIAMVIRGSFYVLFGRVLFTDFQTNHSISDLFDHLVSRQVFHCLIHH